MNISPELLAWAAGILAALVVLLFLRNVTVFKRIGAVQLKKQFVTADPEAGNVPPAIRQFLEHVDSQFTEQGFTPVGWCRNARVPPRSMSVMSVLVDEKSSFVAVGTCMLIRVKRRLHLIPGVSLNCLYDGKIISVVVQSHLPAFEPGNRIRVVLPPKTPLSAMREPLEALAKTFWQGKRRPVKAADGACRLLNRIYDVEATDYPAACYALDEEHDVLLPTWRGALISVWRSVWPGNKWHRDRVYRRSYELLKKAGVDPNQLPQVEE